MDRLYSISSVSCIELPPSMVPVTDPSKSPVVLKTYKRRLWMLFLFSFSSMLCGMLFTLYISMTNVISCYYGVNEQAVQWTGLIFMLVYIVLVFPACYFMDFVGLRWTVICGSACNTIACVIQFVTLKPDRFLYVIVSEFFASICDVLVLSVPPVLAARWFPSQELSRACAFGVFGNQLGVALGFLIPPAMVPSDCDRKGLIGEGLRNLAWLLSAVNLLTLILMIFTFQNDPKLPPSLSQAQKSEKKTESNFKEVISMLRNKNFVMILIVYGLVVGTYFALSTILNSLAIRFFPNKVLEIGWMGALLILFGLIGSVIAGYVLDATHKFKETTVGICAASLVTSIVFSIFLFLGELWVQFITISLYGFFLTSFLPIGFEYGIEVTYPQSENTSAGLLNASTMIFGIAITEMLTYLLVKEGPISSCTAMAAVLFVSCVIAGFITKDYKRSKSNHKTQAVSQTQ